MSIISRVLLFTIIAALGTPALAQSSHSTRYDMVATLRDSDYSVVTTAPWDQNKRTGKVIILNRSTGELWTLDKTATPLYLGRIYPTDVAGTIARIIHVNPEAR